jgi:antitoxin Phd
LYKSPSKTYDRNMATIPVSQARADMAHILELAQTEAVTLERHGKPAVVVVSVERYDELIAAFEDAQDVRAYDQAKAEHGPDIPWDEVQRDLGLL